MFRSRIAGVLVSLLLCTLVIAAPAQATFPGANGKIAFARSGDIWTMNPDGTGQVDITNSAAVESSPTWSPDGTKIAFASAGLIRWMYAGGTSSTPITSAQPNRGDYEPAWSPDGQKIAFGSCCPPPASTFALMTIGVDGTGEAIIGYNDEGIDWPGWSPDGSKIVSTYWDNCAGAGLWATDPGGTASESITGSPTCRSVDITDLSPSWSPDEQRIAFASDSPSRATTPHSIWTIKPNGTDPHQLTTAPDFSHEHLGPVWSPDGSRIAFTRGSVVPGGDGRITMMNADGTGITDITDGSDPDWQSIPVNAYPRPRGATPMRVSLVTSDKQCTAPNRTHGAPLAFPSCAPPALTSDYLTVGTPDSNGKRTTTEAYILLQVKPGDVKITSAVQDVFNKDLSDYTGALRARLPLQITDRDNTPSPGGPGAATVQSFQFEFDLVCTATADTTIGSDCPLATTANALVPGSVTAGLRAIWQVGQAQVYDGGADGNPVTTSDNTLFLDQGVFVP
jgi:dipeptidyl aminopeptidase/acylaminoacyl peptidase